MPNNKILLNLIKKKEPLTIEDYTNLCLYKKNGYYINSKILGQKGDFITAPEISQLFGEIIGIYIYSYWTSFSKKNFNLVELGPGRGTLMIDILNITKKLKHFNRLNNICFIEKNLHLIKEQKKKIKKFHFDISSIKWRKKISIDNKNPTIIIANEFFDCLPIRQFYKNNNLWYEKMIAYNNHEQRFFFRDKKIHSHALIKKIKKNTSNNVLELSKSRDDYFSKICNHLKKYGGMALIIDYGYYEELQHFTLQSVYNNKKSNVLDNIGMQDITSLVNFQKLIKIAKAFKFNIDVFTSQKEFLLKNGIRERANIIKKNANHDQKKSIDSGFKRLTDNTQMGSLFKVLAISKKNE
jgi:cyclopropane-fatty-acyl-phospholipid synthase